MKHLFTPLKVSWCFLPSNAEEGRGEQWYSALKKYRGRSQTQYNIKVNFPITPVRQQISAPGLLPSTTKLEKPPVQQYRSRRQKQYNFNINSHITPVMQQTSEPVSVTRPSKTLDSSEKTDSSISKQQYCHPNRAKTAETLVYYIIYIRSEEWEQTRNSREDCQANGEKNQEIWSNIWTKQWNISHSQYTPATQVNR